jgi:hypothetical protein
MRLRLDSSAALPLFASANEYLVLLPNLNTARHYGFAFAFWYNCPRTLFVTACDCAAMCCLYVKWLVVDSFTVNNYLGSWFMHGFDDYGGWAGGCIWFGLVVFDYELHLSL